MTEQLQGVTPEQLKNALKMLEKQTKDAEKDAKREEDRKRLEESVKAIIDQHDYKFVRTQNAYYIRTESGFDAINKQALLSSHSTLQIADAYRVFTRMLEEDARIYVDVTSSFNEVPSSTLNLVDRSGWLQPMAGDVHPLFDYLLEALSGGNQDARDHIEHLICYKYLNPHEFLLPCLVLYGQGGVGKNLLVDSILATMFGERQVVSLGTGNVNGNFNGLVMGKTICFVDESVSDKADMDKLKKMVGNRKIPINIKNLREFLADNTALYIIGGNDIRGAIRLGGDNSDRRWSIIKLVSTLVEIVAERRGISQSEAQDWLDGVKETGVATDPTEVARWLHSILVRHKDKGLPRPYHAEDFEDLQAQQRPGWQEVCEMVFDDPEFTYVSAALMHEIVSVYTRKFFPNSRVPNINDLRSFVRGWLVKNRSNIQPDPVKVNIKICGRVSTSAMSWINQGGKVTHNEFELERWVKDGRWVYQPTETEAGAESISGEKKRLMDKLTLINGGK